MAAASLAKLANDLQQNVAGAIPQSDSIRQELLTSARNIVAALETPSERVARMYHHLLVYQTSRILIDTKTYVALAASKAPLTPAQLGETTGADPALLSRLLKLVAVEHHVKETGPDEYAANEAESEDDDEEADGTDAERDEGGLLEDAVDDHPASEPEGSIGLHSEEEGETFRAPSARHRARRQTHDHEGQELHTQTIQTASFDFTSSCKGCSKPLFPCSSSNGNLCSVLSLAS